MRRQRGKRKGGWVGESARHSLAAQGISSYRTPRRTPVRTTASPDLLEESETRQDVPIATKQGTQMMVPTVLLDVDTVDGVAREYDQEGNIVNEFIVEFSEDMETLVVTDGENVRKRLVPFDAKVIGEGKQKFAVMSADET
jgi:hypothetical protein